MATAPFVDIRDVRKSFDGGQSFVVHDVNLDIAERAFVALIGASGAGKTTLLKFINRLIEPDAGSISIAGQDTAHIELTELRRGIGYVFQNIGLFPHMSVGENIGITPQLLGWPAPKIAARVAELLDLVELPQSYASRRPDQLSGGQRQRAGVARAIAARPKLVLMDEPFGALDPITRDAVGATYRRLHDELGFTTVMVTHDIQQAILIADEIAVMKAGRLLARDTPRALLSDTRDPDVAALMAMPKRQAEQIRAIVGDSNTDQTHE
ncbi:MAG TPA: ATP-binding cassette domain-containing protein [Xanthobacteraceae bacterium]|nr:ATP-binding cassette domain-containing protein [Xanthobacteraceae bacterium]